MHYFQQFFGKTSLTYLVVGGLTSIIYFGFIAVCVGLLNMSYPIGIGVAYALAVSFHFFANRNFTFRSTTANIFSQGLRYVIVLILNYLLTLSTAYALEKWLGFPQWLAAASAIVTPIIVGYFFLKLWVFRTKEVSND
jgi:putative flippase GtrA